MALEDFIPNVFGQAPTGYEGLLGADRTQALQKTANLQGLLGAASALAQGMSAQGSRRSALQNVLGALSGGFQGSQGAYQQGLQQFSNMQTIEQAQLAKQQAALLRADVEKVMQIPEVANNPALVASLRADPAKALAFINENLPITQAYQAAPQPAPQPAGMPSAIPAINAADGQVLSPVSVTAQGNPLLQQKQRLMEANQRLTGLAGDRSQKAIESNLKQIENIDKQIKTDFDIEQRQKDFTNETRRVAARLFPNVALEDLDSVQLGKLQDKLTADELEKRRAGATRVDVNTGKAFGTEFGKGVAESVNNTFVAAQGAQSTLSTIQNIRPFIKAGVYAGPLSKNLRVVDQLATSLGVTGNNSTDRLKNTALAMQGLANIELDAAKNVKGQGAVTDFERGLIKRAAAGDLETMTQPEVLALLNALEKTSTFKIKAHEKNLTRLKGRKDTSDLADFYSLEQQPPVGTSIAPTGNQGVDNLLDKYAPKQR